MKVQEVCSRQEFGGWLDVDEGQNYIGWDIWRKEEMKVRWKTSKVLLHLVEEADC
jgi:hypothetical protein